MNNRKLATLIAATESYHGGYIFPGEVIYGDVELLQRQHGCSEVDRRPFGAMVAENKRRLAAAPVEVAVRLEDWPSDDYFRAREWVKEGPCRWQVVADREGHWINGELHTEVDNLA